MITKLKYYKVVFVNSLLFFIFEGNAQKLEIPDEPNLELSTNRSIDYVLQKYEQNVHGIDCLFYPAKKPKRLYVIFAGAIRYRYVMWSWFWREEEDWEDIAYLFLKDDSTRWYVGTAHKPLFATYHSIIEHFIAQCNISNDQVCTIGLSMGGYAALSFGFLLGCRIIFAGSPQVTLENALRYVKVPFLEKTWVDIFNLIEQQNNCPSVYVQCGLFEPDNNDRAALIQRLRYKKGIAILDTSEDIEHNWIVTKETVLKTLYYLEKMLE